MENFQAIAHPSLSFQYPLENIRKTSGFLTFLGRIGMKNEPEMSLKENLKTHFFYLGGSPRRCSAKQIGQNDFGCEEKNLLVIVQHIDMLKQTINI